MFPVETVADTLFEAVDDAETRKAERTGPWGVARKFWSVEEEHYHEEVGLLVGSIFVLGQAAITQTVSLLGELRKHEQAKAVIPEDAPGKLASHAENEVQTGLSKIVLVNAVANYFKHVYEWPEHWDVALAKRAQAKTIAIVLQLGMSPGEMTDNLLLAADRLGLCQSNPRAVAGIIQQWRERCARVLYPSFGLPDPNREIES